MAQERPIDRALDRLERMFRRDLEESRRERRQWREKLKALNELQARNRGAIENSYRAQDIDQKFQNEPARGRDVTDEKLNAFIDTVKKLVDERREGEP